jgi:hypothetical protein
VRGFAAAHKLAAYANDLGFIRGTFEKEVKRLREVLSSMLSKQGKGIE